MPDTKPPPDPDDAAVEREIRSKRKFSIAEAIGRSAGGLLKGTSPVTRKRQAEVELKLFLEQELTDQEGALTTVLLSSVIESEVLLDEGYSRPFAALAAVVAEVLEREKRLAAFVRRVDAEWGRMYSEQPLFEQPGRAPAPHDPYTVASVRASLARLLTTLQNADGSDGT